MVFDVDSGLIIQIATVVRERRPGHRAAPTAGAAAASTTRGYKLNALAAVLVVHIQPRARATTRRVGIRRACSPNDDVLVIWRPGRFGRRDVQIREYRARIAAVGVHQPEIVLVATVRDEGD